MKNIKKKHLVLIGERKKFNLENLLFKGKFNVPVNGSTERPYKKSYNLLFKGKFNVPVNGSMEKSYEEVYNCSKLQNANIAAIEEKNDSLIKGSFYLSKGNVFCSDNFIKGSISYDYTSNKYVLLNTF